MVSLRPKQINFISRYRENPAEAVQKRRRLGFLLPALAVVLVVACVEGWYLYNLYGKLLPALEETKAYTQDDQVLEQYQQSLLLSQEAGEWSGRKDNLQQAKENIASFSQLTEGEITAINQCAVAGITVDEVSFAASTGLMTISCTAVDQALVPDFVTALKKAGIFGEDVFYYGEMASLKQNTAQTAARTAGTYLYTFTVTGSFAGGES